MNSSALFILVDEKHEQNEGVKKMTNIWEHPSVIASEALKHLEDALVIGPLCARDVTSEFSRKSNGWKVGDTVSFRTNGEYEVTDFSSSIVIQDIQTSSRSMTIEHHFDVSVEVTARESSMDLDSFSEQVIMPASYKLAEKVDTYIGTKILDAQGLYVTDDLLGSAADVSAARKAAILQQLAMDRFCLVDLDLEAYLLGQTWYNQSQTRGKSGETTLRTGEMGHVMGMDFYSSIAFPTPTSAFDAGNATAVVNNTAGTKNRIGDTVLTFDGGANAIKSGDRLYVAGVRRPLVTAAAVADASVATEVALAHPITEIIPDNAAITVIGSGQDYTVKGSIFDKQSLAVAFPVLDLPGDKEVARNATNNGVSIRIVKGYDINTKKTTLSMDLLVGAFCLDPRRITLLGEY